MKLIIFILSFSLLSGCLNKKEAVPKNTTGIYKIEVNQKGYVPAVIKVAKGTKNVTLLFTRTTEKTCAREVVLEEQNINEKLPLNQEVKISFALNNKSELVFGCHMNKMFSGRIVVQ